jgi:ABC-2 type transport system ATP-binding protein
MKGRGGSALAVLAAAAAALLAAAPALAAERGFVKQTYTVPVSQPDEYGAPVQLETDVYLPRRAPPRRGFPLVVIYHGGGSNKDNRFDSGHAKALARRGYAALLWSARGHGGSGGQTTVIGPKEVRDGFEVIAWALGIGEGAEPAHPDFRLDRGRIGAMGESQGGLHTNLLQAWSRDRDLNPHGIRFRALSPGNTPHLTYEALVENEVVKMAFGLGLAATYFTGGGAAASPLVDKWIATAAADQPGLAGGGLCERSTHDTPTSTMKQDLAVRSPGCFVPRMRPPSLWVQAFDDHLFPVNMAVAMWRRMPHPGNRLYLDMGGHAAPFTPKRVERAEFRAQLEFFDHHLRGRPLDAPEVVYWTRKIRVRVPSDTYIYPGKAWRRQSAAGWPPRGTRRVTYRLSADGRAVRRRAERGSLPLAPLASDEASNPVAAAALAATPLGASPVPERVPATSAPGSIAGFQTRPFRRPRELSGAARATVRWTPASAESQVVMKLFARAPDGRLTLLGRAVQGLRQQTPGEELEVRLTANHFAARIPRGHSLLAWFQAADPSYYKPYAEMAGGTLRVGPAAILTLPLRRP